MLDMNSPFEKKHWVLRHQKLLQSEWFYMLILFIHLVAFLIFSVGLNYQSMTIFGPVCPVVLSQFIPVSILLIYCIVHALILIYFYQVRLRYAPDHLSITRDGKVCVICWGIWLPIWLFFSFTETSTKIASLSVTLTLTVVFYLSIGWGVVETYNNERQFKQFQVHLDQAKRRPSILAEENTFNDVLQNPELMQEFENFLRGEWCVENLVRYSFKQKKKKNNNFWWLVIVERNQQMERSLF